MMNILLRYRGAAALALILPLMTATLTTAKEMAKPTPEM